MKFSTAFQQLPQNGVTDQLGTQDTGRGNPGFHLEGGLPVLNTEIEQIKLEQAEAKKRDERYRDANLKVNARLMLFTGLLVLTSAISGTIIFWEARIASNAADAAGESAYAACKSAQIARSALVETENGSADTHSVAVGSLLQAAAVTRAEAAEVDVTSPKSPPEVHIVDLQVRIPGILKNTGKTSALNFRVLAEIQILKPGLAKKLDLHFRKGAVNRIYGGLVPEGESIPADFYLLKGGKREIISRDEASRLGEGNEYLLFFGQITYQDVFAVRRLHTFCWLTGNVRPEDVRYTQQCAAYNTTDISKPAPETVTERAPIPPEITCVAPEIKR